jgi:predicted molibdopterin-dependent oxidoreductase YjgC
MAGINYRRLDNGSLQWPCPSEDHPGTCILHEEIFSRHSGKGYFVPLKYRPPAEITDAEYPLMLMTGRRLYHYHATMTRKVDILNTLMSEEELKINPADASELGIKPGDMARVKSRQGEVKVRAVVTEAVPEGVVHMAFHFFETPTNELISSRQETLDPVTGTPAYKTCPVRVSRDKPASSREAMVSALHRASRDSAFASRLARDTAGALKEYNLSGEEIALAASGDINKIEAFTGKLDERVRYWVLDILGKNKS